MSERYEGKPGWFSLIARCPRDHGAGTPKGGAAPIPVYGWDLTKNLKCNHTWKLEVKVATGQSPVAPATLATL